MVLAEDETFACNIVLNDRAARRVLGTSASKVVSEFEKVTRFCNIKSAPFYVIACMPFNLLEIYSGSFSRPPNIA